MFNPEDAKPDFTRSGNDIKAMEHPTLKVPYELLNKRYRVSQKIIEREVSHLTKSLNELKRSSTISNVHKALGNVAENLKVIKRKADESISDEYEAAQVCKRRLDHLKGMFELPYSDVAINVWKRKRLDRLLVDHFSRDGQYETACKLADQTGVRTLTNLELFLNSQKIEASLQAGDTTLCLNWCHDNKSKLRKIKSSLEFKLRQQEFIELVKQNKKLEAILHARKHLGTVDESQRKELEQMMMLIAQPLNTQKEPYRSLLDESRWQKLVDIYRQDNCNLFQLNSISVFSVVLQTGLSALKTPECYRKTVPKHPECPICSPLLNKVAKYLPYPHCSQSKLICSITGQPLNENNPPMMLPNGYVYGEVGLKEMAAKNNGQIKCPRTKDVFGIQDLMRVFVM